MKFNNIFKFIGKLIIIFSAAALFFILAVLVFGGDIFFQEAPFNFYNTQFSEIELSAPELGEIDNFELEYFDEKEKDLSDKFPIYNQKNGSDAKEAPLDREEIIKLTNKEREGVNLNKLEENYSLNLVAQNKAEDILDRQYFEHVAPDGEDVSDLAEDIDYSFIIIGENLAKGHFEDSRDLVDGWMNSPDHRDNILRDGYEEIGVGFEKGAYFGDELWVAVQVFAAPSTACPEPDSNLLQKIEEAEEELPEIKEKIEEIEEEMEDLSGWEYNDKLNERNGYILYYNRLKRKLDQMVEDYNSQVNEANECMERY